MTTSQTECLLVAVYLGEDFIADHAVALVLALQGLVHYRLFLRDLRIEFQTYCKSEDAFFFEPLVLELV